MGATVLLCDDVLRASKGGGEVELPPQYSGRLLKVHAPDNLIVASVARHQRRSTYVLPLNLYQIHPTEK